MNTLLRASDSAGFLSLVPSLVGFTPTQSLVLLPFHGTRTYGALRLDLPRDDVPLIEYTDTAVGLVARVENADAVAVVVYCSELAEQTHDGLVLPFAAEVGKLLCCASEAGLRVIDALCVTRGGWSRYLDDSPTLRSLGQAAGRAVAPGDQRSGRELPYAGTAAKELVARALSALVALLANDGGASTPGDVNQHAVEAAALLDDLPRFFDSVLSSPHDMSPSATAALLWCLERPLFRDAAIAQWATTRAQGSAVLDAQLVFAATGRSIPPSLGDVFLGRGETPDVTRLRAALDVVRGAAAHAPRAYLPAPLTAAAWLSWALGRATHAGYYLDLVRKVDPNYRLAALLNTMISSAILPDWAFRRGPKRAT